MKPTCEQCGKVFSSKQAKCNHKRRARCTASSTADMLSGAVGSLFQECRERPSDEAVSRFVATLTCAIDRIVAVRLVSVTAAQLQPVPGAAPAEAEAEAEAEAVSVSVVNNGDNNRIVVNVNNFRIVCTDYIDHARMADLIKARDLKGSLQKVVELLHFNPSHPENMNAYISNALAEHGYSYRHGRWLRQPRNDIAKGVMLNAGSLMNEHNDDPYDRDFTKSQTRRFETFYSVFDTQAEPLNDTINTIVKHKGAVEGFHPELRTFS